MWQNLQYPAKWAKAIQGSHKPIAKVEVWNGESFLQELPNVLDTAGAVDVDETRAVRRTLDLTIISKGYPYDALIPNLATDLLHPASGNELRPYRGIDYRDGTLDWVPLGVFRCSQPKTTDKNGDIEIAIKGNDRSFQFARTKWQAPYVIAADTDLATAIYNGVQTVWPGTVCNFTPTNPVPGSGGVSYSVAATTLGLDITQNNNPWSDFAGLAAGAGFELLFDVLGILVLRPISNPLTQPQIKQWAEGSSCTMAEVENSKDETNEYNGCICVGNGSGGAPVQALATVSDPDNPIVWGGDWGEVPYIFSTTAFPAPGQSTGDAQAQALVAATAQLQLVCRSLDATTMQVVPDPTLQEGDGAGLVRFKMFNSLVPKPIVLSTMTIPLDIKTAEQIGARPALEIV